jgi:alcohol dehydrogenase
MSMELSFNLQIPTQILIGPGRLEELGLAALPGARPLILAAPSIARTGLLDRVGGLLAENGARATVHVLDEGPGLTVEMVEHAARAAAGADFIVGIGGGRVLDAAKAAALSAANPGEFWSYVPMGSGGRRRPERPALPVVAIPTTAGSGSEVTPWAAVRNPETGEVIPWGDDSTTPVLALVDAEIMAGCPAGATASAGMSALVQAMGAYLSTERQPLSTYLSLEAVNLIGKNLPLAVHTPMDGGVRARMAWAATEAGICAACSGGVSIVGMAHALVGLCPALPFGVALGLLARPYMRAIAPVATERIIALAGVMGRTAIDREDPARPLVDALTHLLASVGLGEKRLRDYGVTEADLPRATALTLESPLIHLTPGRTDEASVRSVLDAAW